MSSHGARLRVSPPLIRCDPAPRAASHGAQKTFASRVLLSRPGSPPHRCGGTRGDLERRAPGARRGAGGGISQPPPCRPLPQTQRGAPSAAHRGSTDPPKRKNTQGWVGCPRVPAGAAERSQTSRSATKAVLSLSLYLFIPLSLIRYILSVWSPPHSHVYRVILLSLSIHRCHPAHVSHPVMCTLSSLSFSLTI